MRVRRAIDAELRRLAELAARLQTRPRHHVCYLGDTPAAIADEMVADVDDWTEVAVVAEGAGGSGVRSDRGLIGWLMGSIDHEMGRVWWFGPFVDRDDPAAWHDVADELDRAARLLLPAHVTEEEYAPDERNTALVGWAVRRGGTLETGSAVLVLDAPIGPATLAVRPVVDADVATVGPLHESLFPGTHTTGSALVLRRDADRLRFVTEERGEVTGYIAVERHPDGEGYVDFLGVAPNARRRGLGAELVRAGVAELRRLGCDRVSLTVRADNHAARSLYAHLGFVEERVIVPVRRGFSLG